RGPDRTPPPVGANPVDLSQRRHVLGEMSHRLDIGCRACFYSNSSWTNGSASVCWSGNGSVDRSRRRLPDSGNLPQLSLQAELVAKTAKICRQARHVPDLQ